MRNDEMIRRDLAVLWHPCTQMHDHVELGVPLLPVRSAQGVWLEDGEGGRWLDAISSWWTCLFGHRHAPIVAAIEAQLATLDHVLLAGCSHAPAVRLAEQLCAIAPPGLTRVFYADNGSSAVEIALKMSFHWHRNRGDAGRTRYLALRGGYHGETLGALSVTDVALYRDTYDPLLLRPSFVLSPDAFAARDGESPEAVAVRAIAELRATLERESRDVCALILEPLVQCAGGMRMHHPRYLREARALCDAHGVHLIADEIAVGFGRTGTLFACEQSGISPDFLLLSKGLTGGFLPLSAVLTRESIHAGFYAPHAERRAFLHSHSYTGNPLACSAALAVLAEFREQPWLERNRGTAARMAELAAPLAAHPGVAEVRQTGMILAIELARDGDRRTPFDPAERRGLRAYRHAVANGVLLRPLGDVLYWMPPYGIDEAALSMLASVTRDAIAAAM